MKASEKRKKESAKATVICFCVLIIYSLPLLTFGDRIHNKEVIGWLWMGELVLLILTLGVTTNAYFQQTYPHID